MELPIPDEHGAVVRTLAHEYDESPIIPHGRTGTVLRRYWDEYGSWVRERAEYLCTLFTVKECRLEAYEDGETLREDALTGRLVVTRNFAPHPIFDLKTNQAIRIVHDLDGHASTGRGFTWHDEVIALREQARRTPPRFLPALFAQTLHQLASTTHNRTFPDEQKVFISEHGHWRTLLLGNTWALHGPTPTTSHEDCTGCDVPHPHSHMKESK